VKSICGIHRPLGEEKENNSVVEVSRLLFSPMTFLLNFKPKTLCSSKLKALLKKRAERVLIEFVTNSVSK
jgi:hypothetical protein